jgi:DMSO/TMAO reductase YedYZ heme-binding membrane subunit
MVDGGVITGQMFNLTSSILIFAAAAVPVYLSIRVTKIMMRRLAALLATFALVHATYHAFAFAGYEFLSEDVLEPASVAILLIFGISYVISTQSRQKELGV